MKIATNTFVLGAGASMDYGFPSGAKLKELAIAAMTPGSSPELSKLIEVGRKMGFSGTDIADFRTDLMKAVRDPSIDSFIEAQQDRKDIIDTYEKIAKAIIAILIIKHENLERIPLERGWYNKLFEKLYEDRRTFLRFLTNKVSFITFNYDRSLEYYLVEAVKQQFRKTDIDSEAVGREIMERFPLVHVHGNVGDYWTGEQAGFTPYDGDWQNVDNVIRCASRIKLVTDKIDVTADPDFQAAQRLIQNAHTVHFIGFGFHRDNMDRLGFTSGAVDLHANKFYGTVKGLSPQKKVECESIYRLTTSGGGTYRLSTPVTSDHAAADFMDIAPFH